MKLSLIVLSALAGLLSLVVGLPIARAELERWPRLAWIERNRFVIAASAIVLSALCGVLAVIDVWREHNSLETVLGPRGQIAPITTASAAEREIEEWSRREAEEARQLFRRGDSLMAKQEFAPAAAAYRQSATNVPTKAALTNAALCARYASDLAGAVDSARRAVEIAHYDRADDALHANATLQLGITLSELGKRDEARIYLADALRRFARGKDQAALATAEYAMGVFEFRGGNTTAASRLLSSANQRFSMLQDPMGQAAVMNVLGVTKLESGATDEGIESLTKAATFYGEAGFRSGVAGALLNIGTARQDQCELDRALTAYDQCAGVAKEIKNVQLAALATINAASVLLERDDLDPAESKANEALNLCRDVAAPEAEGWAHLTLASAHRRRGRTADATAELSLARAKLAQTSSVGALLILVEEAKLAIQLKKSQEATVLLQRARAIVESSNFDLYVPEVAEATADLWVLTGENDKARMELIAASTVIRRARIRSCAA